jgi:hypothetical protein
MNHSRYVYLIFMVIILSWPILLQLPASPWLLWSYPLIIWLGLIIYAFVSEHHV